MKTRRITYRENIETFKRMEKVAPKSISGKPILSTFIRMAVLEYLSKLEKKK